MTIEPWIVGGALVLLALNCIVSLRLIVATGLTSTQKWLQGAIVWFIPLLGAAGVYLVLKVDGEPKGPSDPPFGGGANDGMPGGVQ